MSRTRTRPGTRTSRRNFRPWSTRSRAIARRRRRQRPRMRSLNALQGGVVSSTTATNLAVQGSGFFVVSDSGGDLYLTRNGSFVADASRQSGQQRRLLSDGQRHPERPAASGEFAGQPAEGQRRNAPARPPRQRRADRLRSICLRPRRRSPPPTCRRPTRRARPIPTRPRSSSTTISAARTRSTSISPNTGAEHLGGRRLRRLEGRSRRRLSLFLRPLATATLTFNPANGTLRPARRSHSPFPAARR